MLKEGVKRLATMDIVEKALHENAGSDESYSSVQRIRGAHDHAFKFLRYLHFSDLAPGRTCKLCIAFWMRALDDIHFASSDVFEALLDRGHASGHVLKIVRVNV
jgi:hypothetical protein